MGKIPTDKIRNFILEKAYLLFYLAVIIEVLVVIVEKSPYINPYESYIFRLTFLLCTAKVLFTRYRPKEWLVIGLFLGLGAVSYLVSGRNELLRIVMFIAAGKGIDMVKCLKTVFWMTLVGCGVLVLLAVTGIYGDVLQTKDFGRGAVETRYTLGLGHPNTLHCMVWVLTTLGLSLYGQKMKWYGYAALLAVHYGTYLLTDSRTSMIISMFTVLLAFVVHFKIPQWLWKLICAGGALLLFSCVGISVFFAKYAIVLWEHVWLNAQHPLLGILQKLNSVLNGRIYVLVETDTHEGTTATWHLFSNRTSDNYFDFGWVRMFYWYGIIPGIVCVLCLLLLIYFCYKNHHKMFMVMIIAFVLYTLPEAHLVSVYIARNYILFVFGAFWYQMLSKNAWRETNEDAGNGKSCRV